MCPVEKMVSFRPSCILHVCDHEFFVVMVISSLDDLLSPSSVHKTSWLVLG